MKYFFYASVLLLSFTPQHFKSENKAITKNYVPVGNEGFYISSTEITNAQYREFLGYLASKNEGAQVKAAVVHNDAWSKTLGNSDSYQKHYASHPAYDEFPAVNISKEGAQLYCEWLTWRYNTAQTRGSAGAKVQFSLPTAAEWMAAAKGGRQNAVYGFNSDSVLVQKGRWKGSMYCNCRREAPADYHGAVNDSADITAPSMSYMPNTFGIYNMSGNVAEMVADKDLAYGGSWWSAVSEVTVSSSIQFTEPSPQVGFRPVMKIKD